MSFYRSSLNDPRGVPYTWLMEQDKAGGMLGAQGLALQQEMSLAHPYLTLVPGASHAALAQPSIVFAASVSTRQPLDPGSRR